MESETRRHELQYVAENALVCLPQADATFTGVRRAARPGPSEEEGKLARSMRRLAPKLDAERTRVEALWTTVRCQISELAELAGPRGYKPLGTSEARRMLTQCRGTHSRG